MSDTWIGYVFVHLSGYNCIQKLHMGLAKHVHLSGFRDHVQNIWQKFGALRMCALIRVVHLSGLHLSGFHCIRIFGNTVRGENLGGT